jgi:hypothetical protein
MRVRFEHAVVLLVLTCAGCGGESNAPTTPTGVEPPLPSGSPQSSEAFSVFGRVLAEDGAPIPRADVAMRFALDGRFQVARTVTDGSGAYAVEFRSTPWLNSSGRWAARAEITADGYDLYWRSVQATSGNRQEENFRLHRLPQMSIGDATALTVSLDNGDCILGEASYPPCGRARVSVPGAGWLTVSAELDGAAARPQVLLCCVDGNPRWGNPVRIPVAGPMAIDVEVGQTGPGVPSGRVTLRTSFEPS